MVTMSQKSSVPLAPAQLVETLVEAKWLRAVAAIGNDRLGSAIAQFFAQFGAIVG